MQGVRPSVDRVSSERPVENMASVERILMGFPVFARPNTEHLLNAARCQPGNCSECGHSLEREHVPVLVDVSTNGTPNLVNYVHCIGRSLRTAYDSPSACGCMFLDGNAPSGVAS